MYWIDQHTDPKILKLGIKWALYREKKPDKKDLTYKKDVFYERDYNDVLKWWQEKSFIAYLKEPEWKVGETIYRLTDLMQGGKVVLKAGQKCTFKYIDVIGKINIKECSGSLMPSEFSHYYEGQQVESFKYVKLLETPSKYLYHGNWYPATGWEWRAGAEEPDHQIESLTRKNTWETNPKYTQFQKELKSGGIQLEVITKK